MLLLASEEHQAVDRYGAACTSTVRRITANYAGLISHVLRCESVNGSPLELRYRVRSLVPHSLDIDVRLNLMREPSMQHILVIDDDPAITSLLKRGLSNEGYAVEIAGTGEAGLALAHERPPDLVVLDIMMPGINGLEMLRRLRVADEQLPVPMLTAKDAPADQVLGLEAGADDYVVKPLTFEVLLARVRARLQRQQAEHPPILTFADLTLDTGNHTVRRGAREVV
jgi:CheY-like chemotaxis protein